MVIKLLSYYNFGSEKIKIASKSCVLEVKIIEIASKSHIFRSKQY